MRQIALKLGERFLLRYIAGIIMVILITSCDEDRVGQNPIDSIPPSSITHVQTEALPGGGKIYYDLPKETDISYVICEYMFKGEKKIVRSSIYNNYLIVEGLGEIAPCEFTLYLVDHSENRSEPYVGSFTPLEPPYQSIFKTITMEPSFGGVIIRWQNETNALIGAFLYAMGDSGQWEERDLVFSSVEEEKRAIRGYDTKERLFGVSLLDRFGNTTDTLILPAIPLYEKELDKKKFKDGHLLGDNTTSHNGRPIQNIWDGSLTVLWHTVPDAGFTPPQTFTIDLGVEAQLSRFMLWSRGESYYYNQHNLRYFEVWGAKELSHDINDTYWSGTEWQNEWVKLGDFEVIKPSGLPLGQVTDEDKAAQDAGFEFTFEQGVGEIRYVRFVVKETWARTAAMHINEVSFFGDDGIRDEGN
ncbi:DUF5000 domain-containing lipoprotein [Parabacteroides sp. Marseille-P3160]|uniref:DUF5000 domain-containing lipoprotein n=1 Tax=Parabacteroides sp. Marseille-P3160 TaxID=1917887 RepID=UPI0009B995FC|nr:DUF5000 domain-containing lipoprotein [Parabacteroides sp. Marseille-P3160]